jgi:hypothetical protein
VKNRGTGIKKMGLKTVKGQKAGKNIEGYIYKNRISGLN